MSRGEPRSSLVLEIMRDASETEIAEASGRWFAYLRMVDQLVTELALAQRDSRANDEVR